MTTRHDIKSGIIIGITTFCTILISGVVYAAIAHVSAGDTLTSDKWNQVVDSINSIPAQLTGTASLSSNGYQILPSGLILQWGKISGITAADGTASVTFPIAFPNNIYNITTSHIETGPSGQTTSTTSIKSGYTNTGFTAIQDTFGTNVTNEMWFAIGN